MSISSIIKILYYIIINYTFDIVYNKGFMMKSMKLFSFALFLGATTFTYAIEVNTKIVIITLDDIIIPIVIKAPTPPITLTAIQQSYLDAINQARSQTQDCGYEGIKPPVAALTWNNKLYQAAKIHSNDMAQSNTFDHTGSGTQSDVVAQLNHPGVGSTPTERMGYAGYTNWQYTGENIAAGYTTVSSVMDAWLNSPGHCANIMDASFKEVGMAKVDNPNSTYNHYWTQDFGTQQ